MASFVSRLPPISCRAALRQDTLLAFLGVLVALGVLPADCACTRALNALSLAFFASISLALGDKVLAMISALLVYLC